MLRVASGTCPATNPTPLAAHKTGGVEARMSLPSRVLASQRQPEGMKQLLPPVTLAKSHTIDLVPRKLTRSGA